jgi:hypothetical protein
MAGCVNAHVLIMCWSCGPCVAVAGYTYALHLLVVSWSCASHVLGMC